LKELSQHEFDDIVTRHQEWLSSDGSRGARADFSNTILRDIWARKSNLTGALFTGALLYRDTFAHSNLEKATFSDASITEVSFYSARLNDVCWCKAFLSDIDFRYSILDNSVFFRATFSAATTFKDASLVGVDLDYASLPLWCGGSHFKTNMRFVRQLFAHIVTLDVVDADKNMQKALAAIKPQALKSHRAEELKISDAKGVTDET
jgi:uncharacterized protein YjbI with pentapeptide repeats